MTAEKATPNEIAQDMLCMIATGQSLGPHSHLIVTWQGQPMAWFSSRAETAAAFLEHFPGCQETIKPRRKKG